MCGKDKERKGKVLQGKEKCFLAVLGPKLKGKHKTSQKQNRAARKEKTKGKCGWFGKNKGKVWLCPRRQGIVSFL